MENSVGSHDVVVDDPEQPCLGPADDPPTLAAVLDGDSYWTSVFKYGLNMQSSSSSTHTTGRAPSQFSAGQHGQAPPGAPAASSSPSSSSVHDQPIEMLANNSTLANDPESAVWGQEFLSGPIGEAKPSIHACSDDGLQELLYPRTVRELLFSDQLKLDQSPTWDIQPAAKSFAFPLGPDKMSMAMAVAHHNLNADIKPAHALLHHHHYSHLSVDDRLSSSTASSTLSDNTTTTNNNNIDQWAAPNSAQCDQQQARTCSMHVPNSMLQQQQQFDHSRVKQEYNTLPIPIPYTNYPKSNSSISPFLLHHHHHHQNQRLINPNHAGNIINEAMINVDHKPNNKLWPPPPAALIHARFEHASLPSPSDHCLPKHPNELVAFSSSVPLRQGGFDANYFQPEQLMQQVHGGVITSDRHINTPLQYISPASHIGKKSRPMEAGQVDDAKELVPSDQKPNIIPGSCDKQLSEEYNFKRSRVEQQPPPTSTFKSQPVRKEKIGERITTLQQLVSPFGKTDTASVLLEAIGYIKFLQEQVQALSSPYFKTTSSTTAQNGDRNQNADESKPDLRSRGLCLVPLSCTMQVANDNGADYWYGGAFR